MNFSEKRMAVPDAPEKTGGSHSYRKGADSPRLTLTISVLKYSHHRLFRIVKVRTNRQVTIPKVIAVKESRGSRSRKSLSSSMSMAWTMELAPTAKRQLAALPRDHSALLLRSKKTYR